jgi:sec-independent protein translocase protein TatB
MLDLGLTKIAVIGVVALVVIGPQKLPTVARMAGALYGRAQRYLRDIKSEVSREFEIEELGKMHKKLLESASSTKSELTSVRSDIESAVSSKTGSVEMAWPTKHMSEDAEVLRCPVDIACKARDFRRNKLTCTSSVPTWYKNRQGTRQRVQSGAARGKALRPTTKTKASFF